MARFFLVLTMRDFRMDTIIETVPTTAGLPSPVKDRSDRALQNEAARKLLREWLIDTSGYDEQVWPQAKKVIEENRLSPRSRFDD
jgi:hypothetical protein